MANTRKPLKWTDEQLHMLIDDIQRDPPQFDRSGPSYKDMLCHDSDVELVPYDPHPLALWYGLGFGLLIEAVVVGIVWAIWG